MSHPPRGKSYFATQVQASRLGYIPARQPTGQVIYTGSDTARQSKGLPGHCGRCAKLGHVLAHPKLGCADVGCNAKHGTPE